MGGGHRLDEKEIDALLAKLHREAESAGYHLNPDPDFTKELIKGLLVNEKRYGYWACPCRLASGDKGDDLDIICPCDYRDADLTDYGACYCALYVSRPVVNGEKKASPIPERRPSELERLRKAGERQGAPVSGGLAYPVWRCRVCGYLCAREHPPETCPVCRAKKDRFERFM